MVLALEVVLGLLVSSSGSPTRGGLLLRVVSITVVINMRCTNANKPGGFSSLSRSSLVLWMYAKRF